MTSEHPGDDALSALLDGEATSAEAAHVEACAACSARADQLRRAANLIGSPVAPVSDEQRDAAIAAALGAQVVALEQRRRLRQPPAWLLAAAVVVLALGLLPLLGRGSDDDQDTAASSGDAALESEASDESAQEDSGGESATTFSLMAPVDGGDLGPIVDDDDLEDRVTSALRGTTADRDLRATTTTPGSAASAPPCEAELRAIDPEAGALRLTALATLDRQAVRLVVFEVPGIDGAFLRVYVVAAGDCSDVLRTVSFPLP